MKVLLVERTLGEPAALAETLRSGGHTPIPIADERMLRSAVSSQAPHAVVIGTRAREDAALEAIRQLRAARSKAVAVMLVDELDEGFLTAAYDAGLDVELKAPLSPPYLLTRFRALARQAGLPCSKPTLPTAHASSPQIGDPTLGFAASATWRGAPTVLAQAASKFVALQVSVSHAETPRGPPTIATTIRLASVEHQVEVQVYVAIDAASARELVAHQFGEDDPTLAGDFLGELANIFMGALKTGFIADGLPVTGGLPEATEVLEAGALVSQFRHQRSFILCLGEAHATVHLRLRSKANVFLPATALGEGMVLARDLRNAHGVLLLTAGTRLSSGMVDKVRGALEPKTLIEVMPADAA